MVTASRSSGAGRAGDQPEPLAPPVERVTPREQPQPPPDHARQPIRQGMYVSSNAIALTSLIIVLFTSFAGYITSQIQRIADISFAAASETRGYFIDHITSHGEGEFLDDVSARFAFATSVGVGATTVELDAEEPSAALALQSDPGYYSMVASPADAVTDPILSLYRAWQSALVDVDQDDDSGEGLAAQIDAKIVDGLVFP